MGWFDKKVPTLAKAIKDEKAARSVGDSSRCIHGEENCVRCAAEDFQTQSAGHGAVWVNLEDDDLKRVIYSLPEEILDLMRRHPREAVVAGGFIRATVAGEPVHDIDVFFAEEKGIRSWCDDVGLKYEVKDQHLYAAPKEDRPEIQLIWRYPFTEPVGVPEAFDYTIVKAAVWFEEGESKKKESKFVGACHQRFYQDLARKMLVWDCDRDHERATSIPRLMKYIKYGYSIGPEDLAEVITRTCLSIDLTNGFEGMKQQLIEAYKPSGSGKDWSEINKPYIKPKPKPAPRSHDYSYGS